MRTENRKFNREVCEVKRDVCDIGTCTCHGRCGLFRAGLRNFRPSSNKLNRRLSAALGAGAMASLPFDGVAPETGRGGFGQAKYRAYLANLAAKSLSRRRRESGQKRRPAAPSERRVSVGFKSICKVPTATAPTATASTALVRTGDGAMHPPCNLLPVHTLYHRQRRSTGQHSDASGKSDQCC